MWFKSKSKKLQYASGAGSEVSIRVVSEKYVHGSVCEISSGASVHEKDPIAVPIPPPRQYHDDPRMITPSIHSARSSVPNFSVPQYHRPVSRKETPSSRPFHQKPSPLAPKDHQRQGPHYKHIHRKIEGAQGPGIQTGTKLHAMQTMYVGGW